MYSLILRTTTRYMLPIILLFSLFMLLRGHDLPGGGFIGGLVAAAAILLYMVANGPAAVRILLPIEFSRLLALGALLSLCAGLIGLVMGDAFLTGIWVTIGLPAGGELKLGTPLLFDMGVYVVVFAVTTEAILLVSEEEVWKGFSPW